ncbi:MAG TPA: hypothetical protein VGQ59_01830, partial [Cyclobacteriaceae bacterium]|nr:hypothetical protein [Cyclobacteriaceae bacterium]
MLDYFENAFSSAKLIALLAHDNLTKEWYHIFSVVELLPEDISPYSIPNSAWLNNHTIRSTFSSKKSDYSFNLVVEDFDSVAQAKAIFSNPLGLRLKDGTSLKFFNTGFVDEPSGQSPLILQSNSFDKDGLGSVLPKRNSGLFVSAKIDAERLTNSLFKDALSDNVKQISQLTLDWLGFNIASKSEHIGNMYLVAPNPYFRDTSFTLSKHPIGIIYKIKMRKGVTETLKVRVVDIHGDSIAFDKLFELRNNVGLIDLPHEPHSVEMSFYNSNGDIINKTGPFVFLKSIHIGMSIKQADFHVKIAGTGSEKEFVVEKFSSEVPVKVGHDENFKPAYYFKA